MMSSSAAIGSVGDVDPIIPKRILSDVTIPVPYNKLPRECTLRRLGFNINIIIAFFNSFFDSAMIQLMRCVANILPIKLKLQ